MGFQIVKMEFIVNSYTMMRTTIWIIITSIGDKFEEIYYEILLFY